VKPWFNGKLDYSPTVPDLGDRGFPLMGGRLDYVGNRPVAVLVYGRRQHIINLYLWPAAGGGEGSSPPRQGYHLIHWTREGTAYWAVSDVNPSDLTEFVQSFKAAR
jgi:anti-sigma factor RsiW